MTSGHLTHDCVGGCVPYSTVLLLDVSGSMDQTDWIPSRLAGAVQAASRLIDVKAAKYPGDRVGIVTFSSAARVRHPLAPISHSDASLRSSLAGIGTESHTALTDGLIVAVKELSSAPQAPVISVMGTSGVSPGGNIACVRQIIILTDGEHNEGPDPVPYEMDAKRAGLVIEAIGIGTPTDLDQTCLRAIASPKLDGTPRYCFIGDAKELSNKLRELAHHYIQPM